MNLKNADKNLCTTATFALRLLSQSYTFGLFPLSLLPKPLELFLRIKATRTLNDKRKVIYLDREKERGLNLSFMSDLA